MSVPLTRVKIEIPLKDGNKIPGDSSIVVESFTKPRATLATLDDLKKPTKEIVETLFKSQKTTLPKLHRWIEGLVGANREDSRMWIDLLQGPSPMVIGVKHNFTTVVLLRTFPKDYKWRDRVGSQSFGLMPTFVGGTWNIDTKLLVWSGVAVIKAAPSSFNSAMHVHAWPFGNVYADGHVCWGENSVRDLTGPNHIFTMANRFFDTPFNSDLRSAFQITDGIGVPTNPTMEFQYWVKQAS